MSSCAWSARRGTWSLLLALLVAFVLPAASALANPVRTELRANVSADSSGAITVTGSVLDGASGSGVAGIPVTATVGGQQIGSTTTQADGGFTMALQVPADKQTGDQELRLAFAGNAQYAASSAAYTVQFGEGATTNSELSGGATTIAMELSATSVYPGSVVTVSGSVALTTGEVVASASVTFTFRGAALPDSTAVTGSDGKFSTVVEIPGDAAFGAGDLVASFAGASSLQPATASQAVTVSDPNATPTPEATGTAAAASDESVAASEAAAASASPSASASSGATAERNTGFPTMWFLAAAVVVVAAGALTLLAVAAKPRGGDSDDEDVVGLIGEAEVDEIETAPGPELPENAPREAAGTTELDSSPTVDTMFLPPEAVAPAAATDQPEPVEPSLPPVWFRDEGAQPRATRAAEAWDDMNETEITAVRSPQSGPRRGI